MTPNEKPVTRSVADALRRDATDIIELIDGGLQSYEGRSEHGEGGSARDDGHYRGVVDERGKCWRCQTRVAGAEMDGACELCTAWLRGEGDDPMVDDEPTRDRLWMAIMQVRNDLLERIYNRDMVGLRGVVLEGANLPDYQFDGVDDFSRADNFELGIEGVSSYWQRHINAYEARVREQEARARNLAINYGVELATETDVAAMGGLEVVEVPDLIIVQARPEHGEYLWNGIFRV